MYVAMKTDEPEMIDRLIAVQLRDGAFIKITLQKEGGLYMATLNTACDVPEVDPPT